MFRTLWNSIADGNSCLHKVKGGEKVSNKPYTCTMVIWDSSDPGTTTYTFRRKTSAGIKKLARNARERGTCVKKKGTTGTKLYIPASKIESIEVS